jgi:MATE family multidrug resistance protein
VQYLVILLLLTSVFSIRVSNELGAGRPKEARRVVFISLIIATSEGLSLSALLIILRNVWGKVYSNETEVVKYVASMLPLVAVSHFFDSTQCLFAGMSVFNYINLSLSN